MATKTATAVYEQGVLRLLTPVDLPERSRVRLHIVEMGEAADELRRAEEALAAAGIIRQPIAPKRKKVVPGSRRAYLARVYGEAGPISEIVIRERDER
jgi:predicted DNA-binding antitoxin AbrB/MazE fold protein